MDTILQNNSASVTLARLQRTFTTQLQVPTRSSTADVSRFVALAARYAIRAIYEQREFAVAGGMVRYGTSIADGFRQVDIYTGRVLKGEKPATCWSCSQPDLNSRSV